jgi:5-carboxymethyl-2-hydroxymuconate isomerase
MPHLIVEYSANLRDKIDPPAFLAKLHEVAVGTGAFPPMSLRSRASERTCYVVADGRPENGFVHITMRVRPRPEAELRAIGQPVYDAVLAHLEPVFATTPLGLTFEVQEIATGSRFLKNNMQEYWAERDQG